MVRHEAGRRLEEDIEGGLRVEGLQGLGGSGLGASCSVLGMIAIVSAETW